MTVIFFGTSSYCLPVLESLNSNFDLETVVTRPDKPVGRKKILTPSATKIWAQKNNVPVETDLSNLLTYSPTDLAIVADFGQIIPEEIFSRPKLGTFNIHFSKLPDFRGASPVQACLLRGDTIAWITIFKLEKTLDTGPILWQKSYPVLLDDTAETLYIRLFQEAAKELRQIFLDLDSGLLKLSPQEGTPTFCKKLSREDGFVEWNKIQDTRYKIQIYNRFRAYYPWPGVWTINSGRRMKILKCHLEDKKLILDEVQFEGQKPQSMSFPESL